mmetsp:Transcript_121758/g.191095  ORF Transcript_121758/g.191095 Transcript_121758/m.191095 type:complete len:188 (+) Transcript_121758:75-638(+)
MMMASCSQPVLATSSSTSEVHVLPCSCAAFSRQQISQEAGSEPEAADLSTASRVSQVHAKSWHPRFWDHRKLLACYFLCIFGCRLYLRSPISHGLHWALVMFMEDGMSLMSFALGLIYLHRSNGAAISLLEKCVTTRGQAEISANIASAAPESTHASVHTAEDANVVNTTTAGAGRQKPVRLFYFAM